MSRITLILAIGTLGLAGIGTNGAASAQGYTMQRHCTKYEYVGKLGAKGSRRGCIQWGSVKVWDKKVFRPSNGSVGPTVEKR